MYNRLKIIKIFAASILITSALFGGGNKKNVDFTFSEDHIEDLQRALSNLSTTFSGAAKPDKPQKTIKDFQSPLSNVSTDALPSLKQLFNDKIPNKIKEAIDTLENPKRSVETGSKTKFKNALLLHGPPGTGKTTIAEVIARQTNRKVMFVNGGQFINEYQGSGAKAIAELFSIAFAYKKPVVIVIDEVDGAAASIATGHHTNEESRTLKALITALDASLNNPNIFVVCTTNYINKLEKSAVSRFSHIKVDYPSKDVRKQILSYYFKENNVAVEPEKASIDQLSVSASFYEKLVAATDKLSARDIEEIINDAVAYTKKGYKEENKTPFFFKPWYTLKHMYDNGVPNRTPKYTAEQNLLEKHLYSKLKEMHNKLAENAKGKAINKAIYGLAALTAILNVPFIAQNAYHRLFGSTAQQDAARAQTPFVGFQAALTAIGALATQYMRDSASANH